MFKETHKDLGTLQQGNKTKVSFSYEGDLYVKNIHTTCGCTEAHWDEENKTIEAMYNPQSVPQHFIMQRRTSYTANKNIIVELENSSVTLTFTALITQ